MIAPLGSRPACAALDLVCGEPLGARPMWAGEMDKVSGLNGGLKPQRRTLMRSSVLLRASYYLQPSISDEDAG